MLSEIFISQEARINRLDPRLRICFAVFFSFAVALSDRFFTLCSALALSMVFVLFAGVNRRALAKRMLALNGLMTLFWIVLPLTFAGAPLFLWGPLAISKFGVITAAKITLKANAITGVFIACITTSSAGVLAHALERLRVPDKIVHILLLTYRYVFVIEQEYQRLVRAMKTRGFVPKTNVHTYRSYAFLLGMIFVRSVDRAQRVHQAMVCRGFDGKFRSLEQFYFKPVDYTAAVVMALMVAGIGILEWMSKI